MLKGPKHLWNLHERTFIIFFHHYEGKWFRKYLRYCSLKSQGCLLTLLLPITSIVFRIVRICRSLFKCIYLKNQKLFLSYLFDLWNLAQIWNIFKEKKNVIANVVPNWQTVKDLVRPLSKEHLFRTSFDSQHVKVSQTLQFCMRAVLL